MFETFIYSFITVLTLMGIYNFRSEISDILYFMFRNWKQMAFVVVCLTAGALAGLSQTSKSYVNVDLGDYIESFTMSETKMVENRIRDCKSFVSAKLENRAHYEDPKPPLRDAIRIGARSYWDSCAHLFGTNYWKHDITIKGENGGQMLCKAYQAQSYRSGKVDTWCDTVFAPSVKI